MIIKNNKANDATQDARTNKRKHPLRNLHSASTYPLLWGAGTVVGRETQVLKIRMIVRMGKLFDVRVPL